MVKITKVKPWSAAAAVRKGIHVLQVPLGTDEGAKIPSWVQGMGKYKTSANGEQIITNQIGNYLGNSPKGKDKCWYFFWVKPCLIYWRMNFLRLQKGYCHAIIWWLWILFSVFTYFRNYFIWDWNMYWKKETMLVSIGFWSCRSKLCSEKMIHFRFLEIGCIGF